MVATTTLAGFLVCLSYSLFLLLEVSVSGLTLSSLINLKLIRVQGEREGPHLFFHIQIASLAQTVKVFPPNVYFWHFNQKSGGCT